MTTQIVKCDIYLRGSAMQMSGYIYVAFIIKSSSFRHD